MIKKQHYQNADILLMDPCFSRDEGEDEEMELDCIDLMVYTYADGCYHVVKGRYKDVIGKIEDNAFDPRQHSLGKIFVETARIGVYDYHRAIEEKPELEEMIQDKKIVATIIRNFTGTITCKKDKYHDDYVVGKSADGSLDFFTIT